LLLAIFFLVANHFSGRGVDESVVYHLRYGLSGAGFDEYRALMAASAVAIALSMGIGFYVFSRLSLQPGCPSKRWLWASVASMVAAVGVSPASTDVASLYVQQWRGADAGAGYKYMHPAVKSADSQLNIVLIYLESFERTYLDEQLFP